MSEYKRLFFIPIISNNNDFLCPFSHFFLSLYIKSSLICVIFKRRVKFNVVTRQRTEKAIVEKNISIHIEGQRLLFFLLPSFWSLCLFKNACMLNCILKRETKRRKRWRWELPCCDEKMEIFFLCNLLLIFLRSSTK